MADDLPLGRRVTPPTRYDPSVLRAIERQPARRKLGIDDELPFTGEDVWHGYELSWLAPSGVPRVGVLTLRIPAESTRIVESKSLKLYLNGFSGETFEDAGRVARTIREDLTRETDREVRTSIRSSEEIDLPCDFTSFCLDALPASAEHYEPATQLLIGSRERGADAVHTHLFRAMCPITGQPDWGSVRIAYRGRLLDRVGVLRYLISYRHAADFHEIVAERIFVDVLEAADATELTVDARYLRRGGIDINPFRSTNLAEGPPIRLPRQ